MKYEYKTIELIATGWLRIRDEDMEMIISENWEIVFFHVDKASYVLQLKKETE